MNVADRYKNAFKNVGFDLGRLVAFSKATYSKKHPNNLVLFNANILTLKGGKIWFGDLDITVDSDKLQKVANELNEELFILREFDFRFVNQQKSIIEAIEKAAVVIKPSKGFVAFLRKCLKTVTKSTKNNKL